MEFYSVLQHKRRESLGLEIEAIQDSIFGILSKCVNSLSRITAFINMIKFIGDLVNCNTVPRNKILQQIYWLTQGNIYIIEAFFIRFYIGIGWLNHEDFISGLCFLLNTSPLRAGTS